MNATPDSTLADPAQLIADLQRQLAECRAERDEAREYQTATSDVLNVISRSIGDVQPVLDTGTETAVRLCGADTGSLRIREGEVYRAASHSAIRPDKPCRTSQCGISPAQLPHFASSEQMDTPNPGSRPLIQTFLSPQLAIALRARFIRRSHPARDAALQRAHFRGQLS
jgi:hypothetical protein